jgi:tetratricopeptide (TPR) repeat protein
MQNPLLANLYRFLIAHYDREELRTLCFHLDVEYDDLPAQGRSAKARELVRWIERRGRLVQLSDTLRRDRSGVADQLSAGPYTPPPWPDPGTLPDPGLLPPGSLLPFHRNDLFTGRVAPLLALAQALRHDRAATTLVTQAIQGMGGIGKTQLAVEFAYRYGRFFQGVHWLNAAQPAGLDAEVAACGAEMRLPLWPQEQPEQVELTLRHWRQDGPRLVVLDNLEDLEAAREWLKRLSGGAVRLLVTARRGDWPDYLGLAALPLELFAPSESRDFLRRYLPRVSGSDLDTLAERLGHLPLALELAGRYLKRRRRLTVAGYLEELQVALEHVSMRGWKEEWGSPTEHDLDMAATFEVSWEQVKDEAARRVFGAAGYCAPNQPIPCEVLEGAAGLDEEACDEALGDLVELGLLEWKEDEPGPTIHPLLAEYARAQEAGGDALPALADTLQSLARSANEQMGQTGSLSHFEPFLPHVRPVAEAGEKGEVEAAGVLWNELGYYLRQVADYAGARAAFQRALAIDERTFGPDHPDVAIRVNNLGSVLRILGRLDEARAAYERALAIFEQVLGPEHPNVATLVNNLGMVLKDLGHLDEARAAFERALAIRREFLPPGHPYIRTVEENLESLNSAV